MADFEVNDEPATYDCSKGACGGWCCSFPRVHISEHEHRAIADHLRIPVSKLRRKYLALDPDANPGDPDEKWLFRRKPDPDGFTRPEDVEVEEDTPETEKVGHICAFFDRKKRNCMIYTVRPLTCREFPNSHKCGYYDALMFFREQSGDPQMKVYVTLEHSDNHSAVDSEEE